MVTICLFAGVVEEGRGGGAVALLSKWTLATDGAISTRKLLIPDRHQIATMTMSMPMME